MQTCGHLPEPDSTEPPCGAPGFFEFGPKLAFCEPHARESFDLFEQHNRQWVWYLELRERFRGD